VILLDLNLPDMSGEEVLDELKADPATSSIPVVILSADASAGQHARLLGRGAHSYLAKPLDIDELLSLIAIVATEHVRSAA
jgi:CheY-like chemotaxis protein